MFLFISYLVVLNHHLCAPDHPPLCSKGCFEQESASKVLVKRDNDYSKMKYDENGDEKGKKVTSTRTMPLIKEIIAIYK